MLHGGPLLETASIRDLGDGEGGYVADALGRTMLLPTDVDELKKMRMQEVFLSTKRYLGMVRTRFVTTQNDTGFARKKDLNNIICREWV